MSYTVFKHNKEFGPRKGLEGPFHYPNEIGRAHV